MTISISIPRHLGNAIALFALVNLHLFGSSIDKSFVETELAEDSCVSALTREANFEIFLPFVEKTGGPVFELLVLAML